MVEMILGLVTLALKFGVGVMGTMRDNKLMNAGKAEVSMEMLKSVLKGVEDAQKIRDKYRDPNTGEWLRVPGKRKKPAKK